MGGVVAYANELKTGVLGVDPALVAEHGAVSEPVALAMARGAVERLGADAAVSVTGIAGPGGGSEAKPVGTIWYGVASDGRVDGHRALLPGTRHDIRRARGAGGAASVAPASASHTGVDPATLTHLSGTPPAIIFRTALESMRSQVTDKRRVSGEYTGDVDRRARPAG